MRLYLANFISWLLHPIFIPTYTFILFFLTHSYLSYLITTEGKLLIIGVVFVCTAFLPAFFLAVAFKGRMIKQITMETREDRVFPYIIISLFYYLAYYLLRRLQLPAMFDVLYILILGANMLIVATLIINFWWKISAHLVAIGGITGAFISISYLLHLPIPWVIVSLFFIAGFIGFARLQLKSHNIAQIGLGYILGVAGMMILLFSLLKN